jgi:hypothetical protein
MENDMASAKREAGGVGGGYPRDPARRELSMVVTPPFFYYFLKFFIIFSPDIVKAHTHGQD